MVARNSRKKKLFWTVATILVLVSVINFTAGERMNLSPVETLLRDMIAPLQSGATIITDGVTDAFKFFGYYQQLEKENQRLQEQVASLSQQNSILEEARLENFRLRRVLNLTIETKEELGKQPVVARIIGSSPGNWMSTITIDKGMKDGIEKDMAVIAPEGLVGRVIAVSNTTAEVILIVDRDGAVGAMLQISRVPGIIEGTEDELPLLRMVYLPHDALVRKNQVVTTSGYNNLFPKGIRIGYVIDVEMEPNGLLQTATIQPFVDFRRIEEVVVLPFVDYIEEIHSDEIGENDSEITIDEEGSEEE